MEQLTDKLMDRRITDMVIVVQDEDEWLSDAAQFIDQRGNQVVDRRRLGRVQQPCGVGASARECHVDRGDEVARKTARSLSVSSRESQATGQRVCSSHSTTAVVLPEPADATIRVSVASGRSDSLSTKRWRGTQEDAGSGLRSFVRNKGNGTSDMGYNAFSCVCRLLRAHAQPVRHG